MNWQTVFFDFDGVILDSVDIKTHAFAKLFRKYGSEVEAQVISYHTTHKGMSRFDKFRYYYENLLQMPINEDIMQELSAEFSRTALSEVVAAPFMPGAAETLDILKKAGVPLYVVSATPENEMKVIVKARGLSHYFEEVHGSPRKKADILRDILLCKGLDMAKCLFIGDAVSDYNAAREVGVCFLGITKDDSLFPPGTWVSKRVTAHIESSTGAVSVDSLG